MQNAEIEPVPIERRRSQARAGTGPAQQHPQRLSTTSSARCSRTPTASRSESRTTSRPKVAADLAYQNAKENTPHTARIEHDQALGKVMRHLLKDDTEVYKQFVENDPSGDLSATWYMRSPAKGLTKSLLRQF